MTKLLTYLYEGNMRRNLLIGFGIGLILIIGLILGLTLRPRQTETKTPIHIAAMLEKESNPDQTPYADSVDAKRGIELCAQEINAKGLQGANGSLELVIDFYYDENLADTATQVVYEMLQTNPPIVVLGHAQSQVSARTGVIYAQNELAAITASSLNDEITRDNPWYFRVLPNSSAQSHQMAAYIYEVLEKNTATVIEPRNDAFAQKFSEGFFTLFQGLGGQIRNHYYYDTPRDGKITPEMLQIVENIATASQQAQAGQAEADPGVLVFATRAQEGAVLLKELRDREVKNLAFGSSTFANSNFLSTFESIVPAGQDRAQYSNGVYVLAPIVYDTAGPEGQTFLRNFRNTYNQHEPGMKAATNCDALRMAALAIENAFISGKPTDLGADRRRVRDALANLNTPQKALEGVTGKIYFDANRDPVKPIGTSIYQNEKRISAISQFVEIDRDTASRLESQKATHLLEYENRHFRVTDVAYIGVDINQVSELDVRSDSYTIDFYIWFRARDAVDPNQFEFLQTVEPINFGQPMIDTVENGISYRAYHVKAQFKGNFRYNNYPFDRQTLAFQIKHKTKDALQLLLVPDTIGMRVTVSDDFLSRLQQRNVIAPLGDWELGSQAHIIGKSIITDSTLGNPEMVGGDTQIPYSSLDIEFEIKRNGLKYSLKNLLPLFFLVGLAQLAFFSNASDYGKMYDIVTSVILTSAFFQLGVADALPNIGYTTAMDWMFYILYFMCVAQIVVILYIKKYVDRGQTTTANQIVFTARWAYPAIVMLSVYIIYLTFWK